MPKEECRKLLKQQSEPALMIKFSDTMMGCIIIAFRDPKTMKG